MKKLKIWALLAISMLLLVDPASVQAVSLTTETVVEENNLDGDNYANGDSNLEQIEEVTYYDIWLEQDYYNLAPGETAQLGVHTDAPDSEITYTSSDEKIAKVSNTGVITAISGGKSSWGSATITATWTSPSGKYRNAAYCTVGVQNTLSLDKESYTIYTKQKTKYKLKATCNPAGKITWKSSDTKIATVNSSGEITPKKEGYTTITATAGGVSKTCYVTVAEPYLEIDQSVTAYLKYKKQLNVWMTPESKIAWKSSNPKIATVNDKGVITPKKKGIVTITAKANGITKKCKVTVEAPSISMYQTSFSIFSGSTYNITAHANPQTTTMKWKSSNSKVAKVDKNGNITALKPGTTNITASINGAKAVCKVTVVKDIYKLSSTKRTMTAGEQIKLYVKNADNVWNINYYLKENNGAVSTSYENGVCTITANAKGTDKVMVSFGIYQNGAYTYYGKPCTIQVSDSGISQQQFSIAKGKTKKLKIVNADGNAKVTSVNWSSTATKVATVNSATGVVKGIKSGTAQIKAVVSYEDGKQKTYTSTVKVSDPKLSVNSAVIALQGSKKITIKGINEWSNVSWKSTKANIVTISRDGTLSAIKTGSATVKAVVDGKTLTCKVYVSNPKLENTYTRCVPGTKVKIPLTGLQANSKVSYKSSAHTVATVDHTGNIHITNGGRAEILVNADGKELYYVVEAASKKAIDACERGYSIITTSEYSQEKRMSEGYYDCSALVFRAYGKDAKMLGGISSWAPTAADMAKHMENTGKVIAWEPIRLSQLRPGDLIFYGQQSNGRYLGIYHVSMYYGDSLRLEDPLEYYWERDNIVMVARPAP